MTAPEESFAAPASLKGWLGRRLLSWFERHRRDLPWRRDRDPYRIWVSEVMLQQTQVATVVPYFERFLAAFPTLTDLAAADEQDVLRLWEGLGYYRRARDLHRAARLLRELHEGRIPSDADALDGVPGFGRYTRNAVLSQAFDARLPILEGNSLRVLCRLFGRDEDPTRGPLRGWLWRAAEEILPRKRAGDFNQAIMELGALVCTPTAPRCGECPLREKCVARREGVQGSIPFRPAAPRTVEVREAAVVLRRDSKVLLVQRPATAARWANLWEFPHDEVLPEETHEQAASRLLAELTALKARVGSELMTIRHGVTRFRITMVCFEGRYESGKFRSDFYQSGQWTEVKDLASYPVSAPQRRLALMLARPTQRNLF
jgi:A/G-specific adenine glycosylase